MRRRPTEDERGLTQGRLRELVTYCPASGSFTWNVARGRHPAKRMGGTPLSNGYLEIGIDGFRYRAHRLAWFYVHGVWPPEDIDHVDGDRSNNRLSNLRLASRAQNLMNKGLHPRNTTGFKGVFREKSGVFSAKVTAFGRTHRLGHFKTAEQASAAYNRKAAALHGEFARLS